MGHSSGTAAGVRALLKGERGRSRRLDAWLAALPRDSGIPTVSTPTHFGGDEAGEQDYAEQFALSEELERRIEQSLKGVLADADRSAPALELGAGTGIFSRPLVSATAYPAYFITDTSPEFLRRTRATIDRLKLGKDVQYVLLSGDELHRWPAGTLSLVALRYVLHHVLDWQRFIRSASRLLVPGGALVFEEPCADGFVLQAAMADVLRRSPALRRKMSRSVRRDLDFFVETTLFYARTGIDKSAAEDKHVFPVFRLVEVCRDAGLVPTVYPNQGLDVELDPGEGPGTFLVDFRHNLAVNFGFGRETLDFFDRHLADAGQDIAQLDARGGGPVVRAVVLARKPSVRIPSAREGSLALRKLSRRMTPSPPAHEVRADPQAANGFQLTLDYPPSAALGPRWGHGPAPHPGLLALIAEHDATYRVQLDMIARFAEELAKIDRTAADAREPSWINGFLPGLDGAALYAFVRTRTPRRYLEVGSGASTKFVARAKRDGSLDTAIVSIDPQPRAEVDALCDHVLRQPLESCSLDVFRELEAGDVVFFDGSHRTFTNSDATVFFLDVLPMLPAGTLVGIHDIYLPDDYPPQWNDRYYSEQYLLAAYLLAGCKWLEPVLAAWHVSSHPELGGRLQSVWEDPRLEGVERHGGAFWLAVKERTPAR